MESVSSLSQPETTTPINSESKGSIQPEAELSSETEKVQSSISQPRKELRKRKSRLNISLNAIDSENEELEDLEDEGSSQFDLEKLLHLWPEVAEKLRAKNTNAASILKGLTPEKSESGNISIAVESITGKNVVHSVMKNLVDALKEGLSISSLKVEVSIQASNTEKRPYFPEEIYQHFLEVNPDLEDLVKKLDLDFR